MLVRQPLRFLGGVRQHALALVTQGKVDRSRDLLSNRGMTLDLFPDRLDRSMGPKEPIGKRFVLAQEAKQQVLRLDVRRTKLAGFVAREENYAPGLFCVPFKHWNSPGTRKEF